MNRSILIVICDFLLVSLLAFSTVDINKVKQGGTPQFGQTPSKPAAQQGTQAKPGSGQQDLGDVMRLALDEERKNRDQLVGELTATRALITQRDQQMQAAQNQMQAVQNQMQAVQSQLQAKEQLAANLQEQQGKLQSQVAESQTNLSNLNEQLHATAAETAITKEERAAMEAKAQDEAARAAALEKQLAELQNSNQTVWSSRQALQGELLASEAANRVALAQVSQLHDEVDNQRRENTHLAEGINNLAQKSSDLAHEIKVSRPLTANAVYQDLATNRLEVSFNGVKSGFLGLDSAKNRETQIIVVADGTNRYALCHVHDTPFSFWSPGKWESLTGDLRRGGADRPITSVAFWNDDPRVVMIPVSDADVQALGCKVYQLSKEPYVFQDAVVVGTRENYYGESKFQMDATTPQYLKMDRSSLRGLFGSFNPSSGDLVLSKSGELLGVMVNNNYCALVRDLGTTEKIPFGSDVRNEEALTAHTLSSLYTVVSYLPQKLQ